MQTHVNFVSPPSMRVRLMRFKQQLGWHVLRRRFAHLKTLCSKWTPSQPMASHPAISIAALPTMVSLLVLCDAGQAVTSTAAKASVVRWSAQAALKRRSALSAVRL